MNLAKYADCWIGCGVYFFICVCDIFYETGSIMIPDKQVPVPVEQYRYGTISTVPRYLS
jgi:hypothetical protein